jgi:integrase/recombinase XerD
MDAHHPWLEPFLDMLFTQRGLSLNTVSAYRVDLMKWFSFFGERPLHTIAHHHRTDYIDHLNQQGLSQRTIARNLSAVRQFIYFLISERILDDDPWEGLESYTLHKPKLPRILALDDLKKLICTAQKDTSPKGIRLWTLIELFYATGMRVSELISLKVFSLPKDHAPFLLIQGKGGHERFVFFTPQALSALHQYKKIRHFFDPSHKNPYLFPSKNKQGHITRQRVGQLLSQLATSCQMDHRLISPHSIRHIFATQLLQRGVNLITLKHLLGHQDLSTTQIYTHVQPQKWKELLEKCHPLASDDAIQKS